MSGMLLLMFVQSLFQFRAKEGKWEGYYGEKNYLDMSFNLLSFKLMLFIFSPVQKWIYNRKGWKNRWELQ